MSQGLSSIIPGLSIDDEEFQADELIARTASTGGPPRPVSPDNASMQSMQSMQSIDTCCTDEEAVEKGKMDVHVVPAHFYRSNSLLSSNMPTYQMQRVPRGQAIIIDIEIYENDIQERRFGSHVDVQNLTQLLKGLSFDVTVHKNLPQATFYKVITEFCKNKMHYEANMAIVAILSHGKDGIVYAADGMSIDMEYIYEYFNNKNCPDLQGKPKFFIVQSCRGDMPDQGVDSGDRLLLPKKRRAAGLDRIPDLPSSRDVSRARPTWEDMIIAYSTIPGYASLRDHEKGTWFIQSLVEVFMNHAFDTELVDLLRMTSERLSHFTNEQGDKQTCNVEMRHLYKRIYFNPGLGATGSATRPGGPASALVRSISTPPNSPYNEATIWSQDFKEGNSNLQCSHINFIKGKQNDLYFETTTQEGLTTELDQDPILPPPLSTTQQARYPHDQRKPSHAKAIEKANLRYRLINSSKSLHKRLAKIGRGKRRQVTNSYHM